MKKHDEGYVLAYVTVVLLVFCLVATMILTGALRNLQTQQNSIQKMQDQYIAEGMIEKVVSNWGEWDFTPGQVVITDDTGAKVICESIEDGEVALSATCGTVTITCKLDDDGEYISYKLSTVEPTPTENGGAVE